MRSSDWSADVCSSDLAGDRDAFSTIMTRGNQRLFRVARSVVGNDSEAEDVLQESYLRAFKAIGGFRGDSDVMTWLTRIVVNEARGRLRKRRPTVGPEQIEPRSDERRVGKECCRTW